MALGSAAAANATRANQPLYAANGAVAGGGGGGGDAACAALGSATIAGIDSTYPSSCANAFQEPQDLEPGASGADLQAQDEHDFVSSGKAILQGNAVGQQQPDDLFLYGAKHAVDESAV